MQTLVILTDNFGLNFSGGAIATCRTFASIQHEFEEIIVIAERVGIHPFKQLTWLAYESIGQALRHIIRLKRNPGNFLYFGDFYMTYYYRLLGVPYFFAYHDSWPEQWHLGWQFKWRGLFFIPIYQWVIRGARGVVTVSTHKGQFVQQLNTRVRVIRNGINSSRHKSALLPYRHGVFKVIMLGVITDLKFGYALDLFRQIQTNGFPVPLQIDIYGASLDQQLAAQLAQFDFVELKGFSNNIVFTGYHLLLKTSKMENLSIAVVEALLNHTPVLCFDVGGLAEVVHQGQNGYLIPPGEASTMYQQLQSAVKNLESFHFSSDQLKDFDWQVTGQAYLDFFREHPN